MLPAVARTRRLAPANHLIILTPVLTSPGSSPPFARFHIVDLPLDMTASKNQPLMARIRFACAGLVHGARAERSVQLQLIALGAMLVALIVLRPEPVWWALVVGSSALVIAAEMFNTAIEALADHLHPEIHPNIRIVKDCAAGAVLIASLGAVGVGVALVVHVCAGRM